jgi:hypothetical protein
MGLCHAIVILMDHSVLSVKNSVVSVHANQMLLDDVARPVKLDSTVFQTADHVTALQLPSVRLTQVTLGQKFF